MAKLLWRRSGAILVIPRVTCYVIRQQTRYFMSWSLPIQHHPYIDEMTPPTKRIEILANIRKSIDKGQIIVGAGAAIGLSAKFIEQGGGDLIIIYNSGRYRMAERGSLAGLMPYGNANDVVLDMVSLASLHARGPMQVNKKLITLP